MASAFLLYSSVDVGEYIVQTSQDRQEVWNHQPPAQQRQHLHMRKRRCTNTRPVGPSASIANQVVAVVAFGPFNGRQHFSIWNHRAPTHSKEMVDERFDIVHGARLWGRRGKRMIRIARAAWHIVHTLLDNPQTLPHLLHVHNRAVITVA